MECEKNLTVKHVNTLKNSVEQSLKMINSLANWCSLDT